MEVDSLRNAVSYSVTDQNTNYASSAVKAKDNADSPEIRTIKNANKKADKRTEEKNITEAERYAERKEQELSSTFISKAIEKANIKLEGSFRQLQFSIHEKTNRVMIKVIDSKTHEIIREIPPESTLDTFAKVLELAGLMVDEKR